MHDCPMSSISGAARCSPTVLRRGVVSISLSISCQQPNEQQGNSKHVLSASQWAAMAASNLAANAPSNRSFSTLLLCHGAYGMEPLLKDSQWHW
jgi:hypothetical protein